MPYAIPSPSTSPSRTSPSRSQASRPLRHHMRSQSSDAVSSSSSSFIYVHPASPEEMFTSSSWNPTSPISGPSKDTVPRKQRRAKMFRFTPASNEDGPSSQDNSPDQSNDGDDLTPTGASPLSFHVGPPKHEGPPLVPVHLRPTHSKAASAPSFAKSIHAFPGSSRHTAMVRKKSGELVRSSLKTDFGRDRDQKPRSEPATPTCPKYVHFDTQLEHVKHFLSQQRPAAVSRSGSPVETETEDEPEAFPFPAMASGQAGSLRIKLPNFPTRLNHDLDTYLESLAMGPDGKSLRGIVRVRNLSFEKWVAVRFTLDNWQTVSEVSAEHLESMGPMSDRFVFSIKLQDLLARIEEKTMFIAIRYTVGGREIWDNNGGANYRVEFEKLVEPSATTLRPTTNPATKRQTWSVTNAGQAADRMADLRRELDRLVQDDLDPSPLHHTNARSFTEGSPFSTRYDFGNSLKMFGGGRQNGASQDHLPQAPSSPTKPTSPYTSTTFVGGMPATVFPDPSTSPVFARANLAPDFGASSSTKAPIMSPPLQPYPLYQAHIHGSQRAPSPPYEKFESDVTPQPGHGPYGPYISHQDSTVSPLNAPTARGRYMSHPGLQGSTSLSYSPLLPPSFRDHRRQDSPFGSPAISPIVSPGMSPQASPLQSHSPPLYPTVSPEEPWSPSSSTDTASSASTASTASSRGTSVSSPESEATSMPDSPAGGYPIRPSGPSEFSSFLDRYYFQQSNLNGTISSSPESHTSSLNSVSLTPRRTSASSVPTGSCAQSYFNSPTTSGSSTPSRDESGTTPIGTSDFNSFVNVGSSAIVG